MITVCTQHSKIQILLPNSCLQCNSQGAVFLLHIFHNCVDMEEILKWLFQMKIRLSVCK